MLFIDRPQVLLDVDNEPRPTYTQGQRFCWMQYVPFPTLIITILVFETSFRPYTSGS